MLAGVEDRTKCTHATHSGNTTDDDTSDGASAQLSHILGDCKNSLLRSVRKVVVSCGDIVVSACRELLKTSVKSSRSGVKLATVCNLIVGGVGVVSCVVNAHREVGHADVGELGDGGQISSEH